MLQQGRYGLQSLNYLLSGPLQKSLLTSILYHDLSSGYMYVYVWKTTSNYILSISTLNTKEDNEGRKGRRQETLNMQKYVLEQVICKGHAMYHTDR